MNFAVFSAHAERMDLCLYDSSGRHQINCLALTECTDEVWHGYLPGANAGLLYGYRAYGPYEPANGHRFNPHKLLLDPYARRLSGELRWSDALFGYRLQSARADLSFDRRDSGPAMIKAVVTDDAFNWGDDRPPRVPWSETVIYEAHVRGLTKLHPDIPPPLRGTYAALGEPALIDHLRRLGVTAVELLPIHAFVQDRHLLERGLRNYWGYNSLAFFCAEQRYFSAESAHELRVAIRRLHAAGIEVLLDVVYNHTAEGSELGPTLSFRGLDNASYYRLVKDNPRHCINDTGTGNTFNLSNPHVLRLVMDSLRYWVTSFHIDGFRFDLGVTLGREDHGFDPGSGFFDALRQDPVLGQVKLISEPWDIGPGGYQLGQHPPSFAEWNDRFRDGTRRFWRGDHGARAEISARLAGSSDFFDRRTRRPWASINYVASHDGFTAGDIVRYSERHNEANGEENKDGHGENYSCNWGAEGPTEDPAILEIRGRVQRALLATVFLAHGTPMLLAGDEWGRSQQGNNNAYCQDNETTWLDWGQLATEPGRTLCDFVAGALALRRRCRLLRARHFQHGRSEIAPGVTDTAWFDEHGAALMPDDWNRADALRLMLRWAGPTADGYEILLLLFNPTAEDAAFALPQPHLPVRLVLDSGAAQRVEAGVDPAQPIMVAARSVQVLHGRGHPPA